MDKIIDLGERRALRKLSPLASALTQLVMACRVLLHQRPYDPDLGEIRRALETFDREMDHE